MLIRNDYNTEGLSGLFHDVVRSATLTSRGAINLTASSDLSAF